MATPSDLLFPNKIKENGKVEDGKLDSESQQKGYIPVRMTKSADADMMKATLVPSPTR